MWNIFALFFIECGGFYKFLGFRFLQPMITFPIEFLILYMITIPREGKKNMFALKKGTWLKIEAVLKGKRKKICSILRVP